MKDSDSEGGGDFGGKLEEREKMGSALLWERPTCTFDEMLELARTQRENEEVHCKNDVLVGEKKGEDRRTFIPGNNNRAVTLMK